jgi:cytochrome d ubiquinol oxidase subunit II
LLVRHADATARVAAVGAVATVIVAWGVAQWPYILPQSARVSHVAAPSGTLEALLIVFVAAAVLILPAFGLLFVLDQKSVLAEPGESH